MFLPYFFRHPLTKKQPLPHLLRYFSWNLSKPFRRGPVVHEVVEGVKIYIGKNDYAGLINYYTGLFEFEEMGFMLHVLRNNDLLLDVGANIGIFSLLAAGSSGTRTISFEPVPNTYSNFRKNIALNGFENRIDSRNQGVGSKPGRLKFTNGADNSLNKVAKAGDTDTVEVEIARLDDLVPQLPEAEMILLKIDVEGFETEVFNGAGNLLTDPRLKAMIVELNGAGEQYGFDEKAVKQRIEAAGFTLWFYDPFKRKLSRDKVSFEWGNALYLRDLDFIEDRLAKAPAIRVLGQMV